MGRHRGLWVTKKSKHKDKVVFPTTHFKGGRWILRDLRGLGCKSKERGQLEAAVTKKNLEDEDGGSFGLRRI
jgi:hypothetical protein